MRFKDALMLASVVTAINVIIQSSFAVVSLVSPLAMLPAGSVVSEATYIFALYSAARTFVLTIFVLVSIFMRFGRMLTVLGFLAGVIQFGDMWVGIYQADLMKSVGPFIMGCVQLYAVWKLNNAKRERG